MPWSCSPAIWLVIPQVYLWYAKVDTKLLDACILEDGMIISHPQGKSTMQHRQRQFGRGSYSNCRTNIHLLLITHHSTNTKLANDIDFQPWINWADSPSSIPLPSPKQKPCLPLKARPSPKKWKYPESQAPFFRGELFVLGGRIFIVWAGFLGSSLFPAPLMAILYPKNDLAWLGCWMQERRKLWVLHAQGQREQVKTWSQAVQAGSHITFCSSLQIRGSIGLKTQTFHQKIMANGHEQKLEQTQINQGAFFF